MRRLLFALLSAVVLWSLMFSPLTAPHLNFWWMMTFSAVSLCALSLCGTRRWWRDVAWRGSDVVLGVAIAVALWLVFWTGDCLSALLFDFARPQVDAIYGLKEGESPWLLSLLMLFLIGPAEELFWRGYVQRTLTARWSANAAWIATVAVYALVHAPSCNFMLTMAACVAGAVWGTLYRFFPERLGAIILSHALWDVAVFIWFPI